MDFFQSVAAAVVVMAAVVAMAVAAEVAVVVAMVVALVSSFTLYRPCARVLIHPVLKLISIWK